MLRFFVSLIVGLIIGAGIGIYLGWWQFPVEYVDSPASALAEIHKDDYTLMIANGYLANGDRIGAEERLRVLGIDDVPGHVQTVTERFINNSRAVADIRALVAFAAAFDRLTPLMAPYQLVSAPELGP
ncbi:MAG: hypothetical protein GYB67_12845 [Chloroflexi bacterium]|nr:hypothetical protein [Chloroflexota bacterium]